LLHLTHSCCKCNIFYNPCNSFRLSPSYSCRIWKRHTVGCI